MNVKSDICVCYVCGAISLVILCIFYLPPAITFEMNSLVQEDLNYLS